MGFKQNLKDGAKVAGAFGLASLILISTVFEAFLLVRLWAARWSWAAFVVGATSYFHVNWLPLSVIGLALLGFVLAVLKRTHLLTYGISELSLGLAGIFVALASGSSGGPIPTLPVVVATYGVSRGFANVMDGIKESKSGWVVRIRDSFTMTEEEYQKAHGEGKRAAG